MLRSPVVVPLKYVYVQIIHYPVSIRNLEEVDRPRGGVKIHFDAGMAEEMGISGHAVKFLL